MDNSEGSQGVEAVDVVDALTKNIPDVFIGKSVLVTGVTGFIGKVLLEKLLRCCRGIKSIFVIVRTSPKADPEVRLRRLLSEEVFDVVRKDNPEMLGRVHALAGDITEHDFGLDPADVEIIVKEVCFVFHSAATVRFEEEMKTAISTNLVGVQNLMALCEKIQNLEAVVHVSTAYALCHLDEIHEDIYQERMKPEDLISINKWLENEHLTELFKGIGSNRPSIYHYTKAVAENLIHKNRKQMPTCIVRPSIVTATWREPFPGWIDTHYGPSGLIAACSQGVLRSVLAYPKVTADFVPVDIVVNTLIASAWYLAVHKPNALQVINCTSHPDNLLTWEEVEKICHKLILKYPSMTLLRYPGGSFKSSRFQHTLCTLFDHMVPGLIMDTLSVLTARRPKMLTVYRKIHKVLSHMEYFTTNDFRFYSPKFLELNALVNEQKSKDFSIDLKNLNWPEYLQSYVFGVRRYLLKQQMDNVPAARNRMIRIYYLWLGLQAFLLAGSYCLTARCGPVGFFLALSRMYSNIVQSISLIFENATLIFQK